jgi:hypothetical protein
MAVSTAITTTVLPYLRGLSVLVLTASHPATLSSNNIMTTTPRSLNYGGFPHRPPSHQNSPAIRSNLGRNSALSRVSIGSILSTNEMDRNKSPSGALSPVYTFNEDRPMSTSRVPLYPSVNGPSTMDENFCYYDGFMDSDVPAASRPSGYFGPSEPFPTLPIRPAQSNSSASDTALVS